MRKSFLGLLTFLAFFSFIQVANSQSTNTFYKKDFLFNEEVFRIDASRQNDLFLFDVSSDSNHVQRFDLVDIKGSVIFRKKLRDALNAIETNRKINYKESITKLNASTKGHNDKLRK